MEVSTKGLNWMEREKDGESTRILEAAVMKESGKTIWWQAKASFIINLEK